MDLRCTSCNSPYDRNQHIPHFIPCGCDICASCVQKFVYRSPSVLFGIVPGSSSSSSTPAASIASVSNQNSRPPTPPAQHLLANSKRQSITTSQQPQHQQQQQVQADGSSLVSPVIPVVVSQPYKCPRGHVTQANAINNCPPMIAHRIAEQVRDKSQTCPIHQRRPLDFWCVPCRKALCGVCAVSHKEESGCLLPARPIQQCTGEILKLSYECKGQLEGASRAIQNCQVVTSRMLKSASNVPMDLMNQCLVAVEQFHTRLLKSVDSVWREHLTELRNLKRAHTALNDVHALLETYKEKMVTGEKMCDETEASTRTVDPLPLAATMAAIEEDAVLKFPLKLYLLRGVEAISLDPSGTTLSASWQEPFHGKGEFVPVASIGSSQNATAAAAMLDRAVSPQSRRYGTAARRELSPRNNQMIAAGMPPFAMVNVDGTPRRGADGVVAGDYNNYESHSRLSHTPLGLLSVTDILNMGPVLNNPNSISRANYPNAAAMLATQKQEDAASSRNSRNSTPTQQSGAGTATRGKHDRTPPGERRSPYVQVRSFNPVVEQNDVSGARRR